MHHKPYGIRCFNRAYLCKRRLTPAPPHGKGKTSHRENTVLLGREVGRFHWKKLHFPRERRGGGLRARKGVRGIEGNDIRTDLVEMYWNMPPGREVRRFPWKKLHLPRERRGMGSGPAATGHMPAPFFRPTRKGVRGIVRNDILTDLVEIYWEMPPGRATTP